MHLGKLGRKPFDALGTSNEVEEEDSFLGNTALLEDFHCHDRRTACLFLALLPALSDTLIAVKLTSSKHGIQQQNPAIGNVLWDLGVEELGLACFLVPLNQDLADAYRAATLAKTLLHGLAGAHDGDSANLALEGESIVVLASGRHDSVGRRWQVVETLLNKQADNSIGMEDKIAAICVCIADFPNRLRFICKKRLGLCIQNHPGLAR